MSNTRMKPPDRVDVVFVCNEFGSFRRHREYLASALIERGRKVVVYAANSERIVGQFGYLFRPLKIERFRFAVLSDLKIFLTLLIMLMRDKPEILHLINLKPYLYGGLAAFVARKFGWRGKLIITVAGLGRLYDTNSTLTVSPRIRKTLVETALRIGTTEASVTFETKHDRDFWLERNLINASQAVVINGAGVDLTAFTPPSKSLLSDSMRVLYAGRLLRRKGLNVFLEAAALLNADGSGRDIEMTVAGFEENDPDSVPITTLRSNEDIQYIGPVANMPELLRNVDLVVLPSRYNEGIPRILIEAAASGCIAVSTRFPGSNALIVDGVTGRFVDDDTTTPLAECLVQVLKELLVDPEIRREMAQNAVEHVRSRGFCELEVLSSFFELYGLPSSGLFSSSAKEHVGSS